MPHAGTPTSVGPSYPANENTSLLHLIHESIEAFSPTLGCNHFPFTTDHSLPEKEDQPLKWAAMHENYN